MTLEKPKPQNKVKAHVSEAKKARVAELADMIKNNRTILVASIKNIPGNQFQEIVKKLRGKAIVKVPKKSLIFRAIDDSAIKETSVLKENIHEDVAVLFSKLDAFELASELVKSKRPAKAKPGQIAPEDIEIPEGPTDLVPGPAITELGALGIQIQIEKGKINIKQAKVVANKGEKISKQAAELMGKLNIRPFSIGFIPLCAFDSDDKKLYTDINIDPEKTVEELKHAFGKALPFAVEIDYINDDTITFLIGKASAHEKVLENIVEKENPKEEKPSEETEESKEENKSEEKLEETGGETQEENKSQEEK